MAKHIFRLYYRRYLYSCNACATHVNVPMFSISPCSQALYLARLCEPQSSLHPYIYVVYNHPSIPYHQAAIAVITKCVILQERWAQFNIYTLV